MSDPIKTVIDKMSDELVKVGEAADRKIEKVMEENERLREALKAKSVCDKCGGMMFTEEIAVNAKVTELQWRIATALERTADPYVREALEGGGDDE